MGSCMSRDNVVVVPPIHPAPHPHARRMWMVSTHLDSKDVPEDLVGVDADGLKSALRNRGIETEHWALKIDPLVQHKGVQPQIFDITLEGGRLTANVHAASSPYWNAITRRVVLGWTTWEDQEITAALALLIQARPKYDGRVNNFQQLAKLLAKHIEYTLPTSPQDPSLALGSVTDTVSAAPTPPVNGSQMTLVPSVRSPSTDPVVKSATPVSTAPASVRKAARMSVARPPLVQLATAPATTGPSHTLVNRASFYKTKDGERSVRSSVRMSQLPLQQRHNSQPLPLSSDQRQTYRQSVYDPSNDRTRTQSDASHIYGTLSGQSVAEDGQQPGQRRSRRRSEAPADWLAEMPNEVRFSSVRTKARNSQRESVLSLGGGSVYGAHPGTWGPNSMMPSSPSMPMALNPYGMLPPMWPGMSHSPSMVVHSGMMHAPMPFYPAQHGAAMMGSGFMPSMTFMPPLAPPSPGFHSHASSAVPTPPESPHLVSTNMGKSLVPELDQHLRPPRGVTQIHI